MKSDPLKIIVEEKEVAAFRKVLIEANRDYVLDVEESNYYNDKSILFSITCKSENIEMAFWHLGILDQKYRLSIRKRLGRKKTIEQ